MGAAPAGIVEIVREFLLAHQQLSRLFARRRSGDLGWAEVCLLVGDDASSVLFRLKERCHALFRSHEAQGDLARVALFDLAVGSLFHEAMKLRENVYQLEVYAPKVDSARAQAEAGSEALFEEFEKILRISRERLDEAVLETETLLEQTLVQFRVLLRAHPSNGLVARYLIENAALVADVLGESLDDTLAAVHGEAVEGYAIAADSYLKSGYFDEGRLALAEAVARGADREEFTRAAAFAEGMTAYLGGSYEEALEHLTRWVDAGPKPTEAELARMAHAALESLGPLLDPEQADLAKPAAALAKRLEPLATSAAC